MSKFNVGDYIYCVFEKSDIIEKYFCKICDVSIYKNKYTLEFIYRNYTNKNTYSGYGFNPTMEYKISTIDKQAILVNKDTFEFLYCDNNCNTDD